MMSNPGSNSFRAGDKMNTKRNWSTTRRRRTPARPHAPQTHTSDARPAQTRRPAQAPGARSKEPNQGSATRRSQSKEEGTQASLEAGAGNTADEVAGNALEPPAGELLLAPDARPAFAEGGGACCAVLDPTWQRDGAESCDRYDALLAREDELLDDELAEVLRHEDHCPTGRHSEAALERDLGLPEGALKYGSPAHGLLSPEQRLERLRRAITGGAEAGDHVWAHWPAGDQATLRIALDDLPVVRRDCGRLVSGAEIAALEDSMTARTTSGTLGALIHLDLPVAAARHERPGCVAALWRFTPQWGPYLSLPMEQLGFFLLDGEVEWEDAASRKTLHLSVLGGTNFVCTTAACSPAAALRSKGLSPFRVRQLGNGPAVGLAVFFAPRGLPPRFFDTQDGICLPALARKERPPRPRAGKEAGAWLQQERLPCDDRELPEFVREHLATFDGREGHSEQAGWAGEVPIFNQPAAAAAGCGLRSRLLYGGPSGGEPHMLTGEEGGLQVIVPLVGCVELVQLDPSCAVHGSLQEMQPRSDLAGQTRARSHPLRAASAPASGQKFPDVVLLPGGVPHLVNMVGGAESACLHIGCG